MWAVYAGPLKPDVRDNLDAYYDRPFDVFISYYDTGLYRLPANWAKQHGPNKQMDWGSWLYIVDKEEFDHFLDPQERVAQIIPAEGEEKYAKRLPLIKASDIPKDEWYGILEVECY